MRGNFTNRDSDSNENFSNPFPLYPNWREKFKLESYFTHNIMKFKRWCRYTHAVGGCIFTDMKLRYLQCHNVLYSRLHSGINVKIKKNLL